MTYKIVFTFLFIHILSFSFSQERKLRKAITEINEGNFEKSKQHIVDYIEHEQQSPLGYYLMTIYLVHEKSPDFNLDSAYVYLIKSIKLKNNLPEKEREESCVNFEFCFDVLEEKKEKLLINLYFLLRDNTKVDLTNKEELIKSIYKTNNFIAIYKGTSIEEKAINILCDLEFNLAKVKNTIEDYKIFIQKYPNANQIESCKLLLCELEFNEAKKTNSIEGYAKFIQKYPNSNQALTSNSLMCNLEFKLLSNTTSIETYNQFILKYPNEKLTKDAITKRNELAFQIAKKINTISSYESFISQYPDAKNCSDARDGISEIHYPTVTIGSQKWMKEDLKIDRFKNGDIIKEALTDEDWKLLCDKLQPCFRKLENVCIYNGYALLDPRNICPNGFVIPELKDFRTLISYLGGGVTAQKSLVSYNWKDYVEVAEGGLDEIEIVGTNSSKFSAKTGGGCYCGGHLFEGACNFWWTKTKVFEVDSQISCEEEESKVNNMSYLGNISLGSCSNDMGGNFEKKQLENDSGFHLSYGFAIRLLKQ
jgi:uncharacterized protein (TIGR02145 family)